MDRILHDHSHHLFRQYHSTSSNLSLLLTALQDELLPQLALQLKLPDQDITWLSEWLSDTSKYSSPPSLIAASHRVYSINFPPIKGMCVPEKSHYPPYPTPPELQLYLCFGQARDPWQFNMAPTCSPTCPFSSQPRFIPLPSATDHRSAGSPYAFSQTRLSPNLVLLR